jgi:hypothetical protein
MQVVDIADSVRVAGVGWTIDRGVCQVSVEHVRRASCSLSSETRRAQLSENLLRAPSQRRHLSLIVEVAQHDITFEAKVLHILLTSEPAPFRSLAKNQC